MDDKQSGPQMFEVITTLLKQCDSLPEMNDFKTIKHKGKVLKLWYGEECKMEDWMFSKKVDVESVNVAMKVLKTYIDCHNTENVNVPENTILHESDEESDSCNSLETSDMEAASNFSQRVADEVHKGIFPSNELFLEGNLYHKGRESMVSPSDLNKTHSSMKFVSEDTYKESASSSDASDSTAKPMNQHFLDAWNSISQATISVKPKDKVCVVTYTSLSPDPRKNTENVSFVPWTHPNLPNENKKGANKSPSKMAGLTVSIVSTKNAPAKSLTITQLANAMLLHGSESISFTSLSATLAKYVKDMELVRDMLRASVRQKEN